MNRRALMLGAASAVMADLPALSIRQPWASLIVAGLKDVENRNWPTRFRGRFWVHAGKAVDRDAMDALASGRHPVTGDPFYPDPLPMAFGGIIGVAEITDCVSAHPSPWFMGDYGFVLANAQALAFQPCRGLLGFFKPGADWTPPDYLDGRGPLKDEERLLL